jgi:hypothetical protein
MDSDAHLQVLAASGSDAATFNIGEVNAACGAPCACNIAGMKHDHHLSLQEEDKLTR